MKRFSLNNYKTNSSPKAVNYIKNNFIQNRFDSNRKTDEQNKRISTLMTFVGEVTIQ